MVSRRQLLKLSALGTASFAAPLAYSASNITMTHNTGNPIGSTSAKDLSDNARNLDLLLSGEKPSYLDRKGVPRKSWKGMESEYQTDRINREAEFNMFMDASGYETPIPYAQGVVLPRVTKTVLYQGNIYRVRAEFMPLTTTDWSTDGPKLKLIGDDSLRQNLADSALGSKTVAHEKRTLHIKLYRENLSIADVGAKADGSNETEFFREAAASGAKRILVPNIGGIYSLDEFVLPRGVTFKGIGRSLVYDAYSEANMADSCCIKYSGSGAFFINFEGGNTVEDINFFGGGYAVDGFGPGSGGRLNFRNVTMAKFRRGFGKEASYSGGNFWNCQAAHNLTGIYNFVDSKFFGSTVHGNSGDGVVMMKGANDNTFSDTKNEWNEAANWRFFDAHNISVLGGVTDRSGTYGVISQLSSVTFCGGVIRRSGRFMASESAHFSLGANRIFSINGLNTEVGVDDNGVGYNTPEYIFHGRDNGCVNTLVNGGKLSGSTLGFITGETSALPLLSGVLGQSGKRKVDGTALSVIAAVTEETKSFSFPAITRLGTDTSQTNRFIIEIRTRTPLGVVRSNRFVMEIRRGDSVGAAAVFVFTEDPASTSINKTGASLNLSVSNVGTEGTTFDLALSNTTTVSLTAAVDVFLQ